MEPSDAQPPGEPTRHPDVFGAEGDAATDRAAAIGRFVLAAGFFTVGFLLLGYGASEGDSAAAWWFVVGILAIAAAFALPLSMRDR